MNACLHWGIALPLFRSCRILRPIFQKFGILKVLADVPLREVIALMVCGWAFLGNMAVRRFGPELRFASESFCGRGSGRAGVGASSWNVLVGFFSWFVHGRSEHPRGAVGGPGFGEEG